MANVILLWSVSLLRIKLSKLKSFSKNTSKDSLGDFFILIIIYFYNYYIIIIQNIYCFALAQIPPLMLKYVLKLIFSQFFL